jgi:hypothetical protein
MLDDTIQNSRDQAVSIQTRHAARPGGIVAATWIIGLGVVFLLQQLLELSWGEAWPMFVILAGIGGLVGVVVGFRGMRSPFAALAWPVGLLVVGALLLLSTTGSLGVEPGELVARWWPVAIIAWGAWLLLAALIPGRRIGMETMELPLAGSGPVAVRIRFGGGELKVRPGRPSTISGEFAGVEGKVRQEAGRVEIEPESPTAWPFWDRTPSWAIGLPEDVPLSLQVESGATKTLLDLVPLQVSSLRISTGASDTRVRLPARGPISVRADSGAASLVFEVPDGVAVRVHGTMALGSLQVDETRFPRAGRAWESPGYATAENRAEIEVQGGVGSVRVLAGSAVPA